MFRHLEGCCLHDPAWGPADAAEVLCSIQDPEYGGWRDCQVEEDGIWKDSTDSSSITVARLKDGRYGLLEESEDYTGHGCQCGSSAAVYDTLADLLQFGICDQAARDLVAARCAAS